MFCDVELSSVKLKYHRDCGWDSVKKLRDDVKVLPQFTGKALPEMTGQKMWFVAMNSFQEQHQAITLSVELTYDENGFLNLTFAPLRFGDGHRAGRRFGSDRFLELVLPSPDERSKTGHAPFDCESVAQWLGLDKHYLLGRVWTPFYSRPAERKKATLDTRTFDFEDRAKTQKGPQHRLFFLAVDGDTFQRPLSHYALIPPSREALTPEYRTKMSLHAFLTWAVSLEKSTSQQITKLFSRLSLSKCRFLASLLL